MAKYWEVTESTSGWRIYRIPAEGVTEKEAYNLVNYGQAEEYLVRDGDVSWQVESVELEEEE